MYISISIIISVLLCSSPAFSQENNRQKAFLDDYQQLLITLEESHPNLYAHISKEEFEEQTKVFRNQINNTNSKTDFYKILYKTVVLVLQGHTQVFDDVGFGNHIKQGGLCFLFSVRYFSKHLYIDKKFSSQSDFVQGHDRALAYAYWLAKQTQLGR